MKRFKAWLYGKRLWMPIVGSFLLFLGYVGFVNHTESTEIGIARNIVTGEMWVQEGGGYHLNPPWVLIPIVDTRPVRVSVASAGRGYSAKLVQFKKDEWREFVQTEGWRYWWWSNRLSFNFGYKEEHRGMKDILRGYAYSPKEYGFIVVLEEYQSQ